MNEVKVKNRTSLKKLFMLSPAAHIMALAGVLLIAVQFCLRNNASAMLWESEHIVRPYHRIMGKICSVADFSIAGIIIFLFCAGVLVYIIYEAIGLIRSGGRAKRCYRFISTLIALVLLIYGGFCLLWSVYYYTSDFEELSGIYAQPIAKDKLETVTCFFTRLINEYDTQINRDENGNFAEDMDAVFDRSATLYDEVEKLFPFLAGDGLRAKPFLGSRFLSYFEFTGFFFPFTGEANINVHSPDFFIPSTIAHELAHQRGVAAEDEANFVAVLASLESGDAVYCYSSALLAYVHLGNALYKADHDAWLDNYLTLCDNAKRDLALNNEYWAEFETPVSAVSDSVYTGFLQSYGQELGLQSYGACVDLLVEYYYDEALESLNR